MCNRIRTENDFGAPARCCAASHALAWPYLCAVKALQKLPLLCVAGLAGLAACSTSPSKPIAEGQAPSPASAAEMALMARHDSLMGQTDQLIALKRTITAAHSPAAGPYLRGLAAADAAMLGWMHQYHAPETGTPPAARLAYFQQQQRVLAGVHRRFRATIDSATLFIKRLPAASPAAASTSPK